MTPSKTSQPYRGVIVPLVTPLNAHDVLDSESLGRLIEHVIAGGVNGIFILGTTGEGPSLSYRLRRELIDQTCRQVAGRVPVLVGITDSSLVESIQLAGYAAKAGADAVVAAPPFYFNASQGDLLAYVRKMVAGLTLPLFLYNAPGHTRHSFEPALVREAAKLPGVIGLKDSSANMIYFHRALVTMADRPDFTVMVGPEELLMESIFAGGHGGVSGGANLFPKLYTDLYRAAAAGEIEKARALHRIVIRISATIYNTGESGWGYLQGLKCALAVEGLCKNILEVPLRAADDEEVGARIKEYVGDLKSMLTP